MLKDSCMHQVNFLLKTTALCSRIPFGTILGTINITYLDQMVQKAQEVPS